MSWVVENQPPFSAQLPGWLIIDYVRVNRRNPRWGLFDAYAVQLLGH